MARQERSFRQRWGLSVLLTFAIMVSGLSLTFQPTSAQSTVSPRNVILLIGDGMGLEHTRAAGMYLHGAPGTLSFEGLPYQSEMTTHNVDEETTSSAAAATAMATGFKVDNGVVSLMIPGDGRELETTLEFHQAQGRMVGLVTTTSLSNATPAAFGAHVVDRMDFVGIVDDYLYQTKPNVIFGGGGDGMTPAGAAAAGYTVIQTRSEMQDLDTDTTTRVSGQFGGRDMPYELTGDYTVLPHLSEMAATALDILDNDPEGFFLMVEGGRIDHASHGNLLEEMIYEVMEFSETVQLVLDWAADRNDTLVLVTADHETGGLEIVQDNGQGQLPTVTWAGTDHTSAKVGVWASGPGAYVVAGLIDNTDISTITTAQPGSPLANLAVAHIASGEDDVEQSASTGAIYSDSSDLELGSDPDFIGQQSVGLRMSGLQVPKGATVTLAQVVFTADETDDESSDLVICGLAEDDALTFDAGPWSLRDRDYTVASVGWIGVRAWTSVSTEYVSPDLSRIVQEIIDRDGWQAGNGVALVISGSGHRTAESFEGNSELAPRLHVEFTVPPPQEAAVALEPGWNLVSLSTEPSETALPQVLASVSGSYDIVLAHDNSALHQPWLRYAPDLPEYARTLTEIDESMGLLILASAPAQITVPGPTASGGRDIILRTGWNLVGYPSQITRPVEQAMANVLSQVTLVRTLDSTTGNVEWLIFSNDGSAENNSLPHMQPGRGYWVQVSEDCVWHVPED